MVIEEINRGNPARIFGEMLTLIEDSKRNPDASLELTYTIPGDQSDSGRIYIPENFYIIGTMNIADRSLAMVDLALRRRFAFYTLKPSFGNKWKQWIGKVIDESIVNVVEDRLNKLNQIIAEDSRLGPQFAIGHSYFTPDVNKPIENHQNWFNDIVEFEIIPLIEEYWFDDIKKIEDLKKSLYLPQ